MTLRERCEKFRSKCLILPPTTESVESFAREIEAETIDRCANVATKHAMDNGPIQDFATGGHKIAEKILALKTVVENE
jgi:hypothetical protein